MEIILQQDFPSLGYVGDRVKVRPGYARNFLIPRGIALESSVHNESTLKHKLGGVNAKKLKLRAEAQEMAQKLEVVSLEFFLRAGASGKTFGSISGKDIEGALKREGFILDKKQIILPEPIRKAGEFKVTVKLHSEVSAAVTVKVNTEIPEVQKVEGEAEAPKRSRGRRKEAKKEGEEEAAVDAASTQEEGAEIVAEAAAPKKTRKKKAEKAEGSAEKESAE